MGCIISEGWDIRGEVFAAACSYAPKMGTRKILMPRSVWDEVMALTLSLNIEWGGYLEGTKDENGNWTVTGLYVPQQEANCIEFQPVKGENTEFPGVIHSHVNMPARFSGTDDEYINANHDFSVVVNKDGSNESLVRVELPCGLHRHVHGHMDIDREHFLMRMKGFLDGVLTKITHKKDIEIAEFDGEIVDTSFDEDDYGKGEDDYVLEEP